MKAVNVDDVLKILHSYGSLIFVTDEQKYTDMEYKIANLPSVTPTDMSVIENIKADIKKFESDCEWAVAGDNDDCLKCVHGIFNSFYHIIDKHIGKENE